MPDEKKNQKKGKSESKEQRKPRQARQKFVESKNERKLESEKGPKENPESINKDEPGPEFYNSLKRETDDILKITEEENAKYKKKEILSNWSKYEMPIESYDEMEEQEHLGADYEKLIQAPVTIGGHFQFRHEKSWDIDTGPSLYDKYFDINMDNLAFAISTIPFYERNDLLPTMFTETDLITMNNRSVNFKQKYYKDEAYSTPELQLQDKLLERLKDDTSKCDESPDYMKLDDIKLPPTLTVEKRECNEGVINTTIEGTSKTVSITDGLQGDKVIQADITVELSHDAKSSEPKGQEKSANTLTVETPQDLEKWLDDFLDG